MLNREWARAAEDALWRRSKLGLRLDADQTAQVEAWFAARVEGGRLLTRA